jgi:hypothetical protein
MDFLKKHYEKVLLGVVLLGLVVAVALLLLKIQSEKEELLRLRVEYEPKAQALEPLKFAREEETFKHLDGKIALELTAPHNTVNPVTWVKDRTGKIFKQPAAREVGPEAVKVVRIQPLYLILKYETNGPNGYDIYIERQAAPKRDDRPRRLRTRQVNVQSDLFTLKSIKGPTNSPTELVLEMADTGKTITLTPLREYKEIEGYTADLRYDRPWPDCRQNLSTIVVDGERYDVVAITETDVVLLAKSNQKKTTIHLNPGSIPP